MAQTAQTAQKANAPVARNVEIKARIESVQAVLPRALALADGPARTIQQDDTFFAVPEGRGRLKLREFANGSAELIHYQRSDSAEAKASDYILVRVVEPFALREALTRAYGQLGRVRKRRVLLLVGATRIHLDEIEGLSDHMELEVVLQEGQSVEQGVAIVDALMRELGLADAPRVAVAYLDLLHDMG